MNAAWLLVGSWLIGILSTVLAIQGEFPAQAFMGMTTAVLAAYIAGDERAKEKADARRRR